MVKIYCIEDINDLKYVGATKQKLSDRFSHHKSKRQCSSNKLNLYNSIIYLLEECEESESKERERYWINKLDTVNYLKLNGEDKERKNKRDRERMRKIRSKSKE